jgi:hypothetical protein
MSVNILRPHRGLGQLAALAGMRQRPSVTAKVEISLRPELLTSLAPPHAVRSHRWLHVRPQPRPCVAMLYAVRDHLRRRFVTRLSAALNRARSITQRGLTGLPGFQLRGITTVPADLTIQLRRPLAAGHAKRRPSPRSSRPTGWAFSVIRFHAMNISPQSILRHYRTQGVTAESTKRRLCSL